MVGRLTGKTVSRSPSGRKMRRVSSRPSLWPVAASTIMPASTYPVLEYDQAVPGGKSGGWSAIRATSSRGVQARNRACGSVYSRTIGSSV